MVKEDAKVVNVTAHSLLKDNSFNSEWAVAFTTWLLTNSMSPYQVNKT